MVGIGSNYGTGTASDNYALCACVERVAWLGN